MTVDSKKKNSVFSGVSFSPSPYTSAALVRDHEQTRGPTDVRPDGPRSSRTPRRSVFRSSFLAFFRATGSVRVKCSSRIFRGEWDTRPRFLFTMFLRQNDRKP